MGKWSATPQGRYPETTVSRAKQEAAPAQKIFETVCGVREMDRGEKEAKRQSRCRLGELESAISIVKGARSLGNGKESAMDQISLPGGEIFSAKFCIIYPRL